MSDFETPRRYRGLIVDFGGVLTTSMRRNAEEFERAEGLEPGAYRRALRDPEGARVYADLEIGCATQRDWNEVIGRLLGLCPDDLMRRVLHRLRLERHAVDLVRRARAAGVRVALLSNSFGLEPYNVYRELGVLDLCDVVVLSELEGVRKPAPAIYRRTCERLGLPPGECVFVDDMWPNIVAARAEGMTAVLCGEPGETSRHVNELFGL